MEVRNEHERSPHLCAPCRSAPLRAFQGFTPWGLLSGVLFVTATAFTFYAIRLLGLSVASGVWCGTAILCSFGYGVAFGGDTIANAGLAAAALALAFALCLS